MHHILLRTAALCLLLACPALDQRITSYGLMMKHAANNGTLSFKLITADKGKSSYTLIRRTRQAQGREKITAAAVKISYTNLHSSRDADHAS